MEPVFHLLDSLSPLEEGLRDYLEASLHPTHHEIGEPLVKEGTVARSLGFIEKGLIRGFRTNYKGHEFTSWFMKEGDVYASVRSFFRQQPATETVQCLEPTTILSISFQQYQSALKKWSSFHRHRADLLEKYYLQSDEREEMRQDESYNRFCFLMKHYPELESRVQDQYLASFLNLTPTYYSNVKSKYFKNNPRPGSR
ncbi:Crp/Fnr family transcriptional regulator [Puia dinghuensis]|uniref:Crp/Fnr family transcriptional regulator n=1 Tax=Puia dinghuensis TaxID=1792502 RepID=A0A8J2XSG9_9BACT|nr:cyclic nucleotide-binding domain-containing protein [Puia dinghuensis]GGB08990.1 Crp/Fnr family transcriptional regulator [Puia dinghuensis]